MKDFFNDLDSDYKFIIAVLMIVLIGVAFIVVVVNISKTIDLYLLRDNYQAVTLYLHKGN